MKKAMNWIITTIAIASIALSMVGCGQIERTDVEQTNTTTATDNNIIDISYVPGTFEYKKDTPNEVYTGYTKAMETLKNVLGTNVEQGKEYPYGSHLMEGLLKPSETEENTIDIGNYMLYRVPDYDDKPTVIIFLFDDDKEAAIASDSQNGYYFEDGNKLDTNFEQNMVNGAFAYRANNCSDCIISEEAGPVSTVWEYDSSSNQVSLVWENWDR